MNLYNPFKPHITKQEGIYLIRRFSIGFGDFMYLDTNRNIWTYSPKQTVFETEREATEAYKQTKAYWDNQEPKEKFIKSL